MRNLFHSLDPDPTSQNNHHCCYEANLKICSKEQSLGLGDKIAKSERSGKLLSVARGYTATITSA